MISGNVNMIDTRKKEIRRYMILLCIVGFCICLVNYRGRVTAYNTTMLALSYEYGFTSRSLLGTLYHGLNAILPIDIMQYNAVLVFALVATGLIFIFLMFFVYKCLCRLEGKSLKYAEYALMLLSICIISSFTFANNYLRVDIFMIATSLAAVLAMFNKKTEWLTIVFSAIGVMFHQGFVLMYFNIILVLLFYKWMSEKNKVKYAILFFASFIVGSALFVWFELLILLLTPYLELIVPSTGFVAIFIPCISAIVVSSSSLAFSISSLICSEIFSLATSTFVIEYSSALFVYFSTIFKFAS